MFTTHFNNENQIFCKDMPANFTALDACALSLDVYGGENRPPLPKGWSLYRSSKDELGYFGNCYIKQTIPNFLMMAFAHRGTVPTNPYNLYEDFQVMLGKIPLLYEKADAFVQKCMQDVRKEMDIKWIYFISVGHSLGAVLANLCALFDEKDPNNKGVNAFLVCTFEDPGSKPMAIELLKSRGYSDERIKEALGRREFNVYLSHINLINTCNEQLVFPGNMFRLQDMAYDYDCFDKGPYYPILSSIALNPYYAGYTLDQHSINKIYEYLKANKRLERNTDQPVGFNNGYAEYLNQPHREQYWYTYFNILWNRDQSLQDQYGHDISKFLTDARKALDYTRQEVLGNVLDEKLKVENNSEHHLFFKAKKEIDDTESKFKFCNLM
jgi:hypothetical protein